MNETAQDVEHLDGRVARRRRNVETVLDVVLDLFAEDALFPTIEQVAHRSGISPRSLYRYFADAGELLEAAIARGRAASTVASYLPAIGQGPLEQRIEDFVAMRVGLYEQFGARYRATVANAPHHPRIAEELARSEGEMRRQFEAQFADVLDRCPPSERASVSAAGDLITQIGGIAYLRREGGLSDADTQQALVVSLTRLFG